MNRPPPNVHGKEGADGSSPSEGFQKSLQTSAFLLLRVVFADDLRPPPGRTKRETERVTDDRVTTTHEAKRSHYMSSLFMRRRSTHATDSGRFWDRFGPGATRWPMNKERPWRGARDAGCRCHVPSSAYLRKPLRLRNRPRLPLAYLETTDHQPARLGSSPLLLPRALRRYRAAQTRRGNEVGPSRTSREHNTSTSSSSPDRGSCRCRRGALSFRLELSLSRDEVEIRNYWRPSCLLGRPHGRRLEQDLYSDFGRAPMRPQVARLAKVRIRGGEHLRLRAAQA
jgi:hypothetical protein